MLPSGSPAARLSTRPAATSIFGLLLLLGGTLGAQPIVRLGAMGDSLSDEYFESTYDYAHSWTELVVAGRGISMGPLASEDFEAALPEGDTWGEPRRTGFQDNWARASSTTDDAIAQGQHTGVAQGAVSRGVSHAVLFAGSLDFAPTTSAAWSPIYAGTWDQTDIDSWIAGRILNLRTILDALLPTGVHVVLASPPDVTASPLVDLLFTDVAGQERVAGAVRDFSLAIRSLADEKHLVFADGRTLTRQLFGTNGAPRATLLVGNVGIDMNGVDTTSGSIPTAAFVDDGVHPNTVIQGILANLFLAALRHYGAPEELFSEAEILAHAGLAYGGSDTLLGELEATFEDYVVDYFVLFSDGFESSDTGSWSFAIP
jgi:hypothetical protein